MASSAQNSRPLLVHLSPLPKTRNGIADYAAALLARLAEAYDCLCVVDDPEQVAESIRARFRVISHEAYRRRAHELAHERHLAHLGNNGDHLAILEALDRTPMETPLVVAQHDLTLHHLMGLRARAAPDRAKRMTEIIGELHGAQGAEIVAARSARKLQIRSAYAELNGLPFLKGVARAVISHSHYGRVALRAAGYAGEIEVVPHFAEQPAPDAAERGAEFRRRHAIPPETTLFASLGFIAPNKRIGDVLQALARSPAQAPDWRYVVGGENRDPSVPEAIEALGLQKRVILLDYLDPGEFDAILAAADALVNLRWPTSGEASGSVCRALAHGAPCVLHAQGWYAELPQAAAWRISPGPEAAQELSLALMRCLLDDEERAAKSAAARAYAQAELSLDHAAKAYVALIERVYAATPAATTLKRRDLEEPAVSPEEPLMEIRGEDLESVLATALKREFARSGPADSRRFVIEAPGPALDWARLEAGDPEGPSRAVCAIELAEGVGGLVLAAYDAAIALREGDLLTLAIISSGATPETAASGTARAAAPHPHRTAAPPSDDPPAHILTRAGFRICGRRKIRLFAAEGGAPRQIDLLAARKISQAAPLLAYFNFEGVG